MTLSFRFRILAATTAHPLRTKAIRHVATAADTRLYFAECLFSCATFKNNKSEGEIRGPYSVINTEITSRWCKKNTLNDTVGNYVTKVDFSF